MKPITAYPMTDDELRTSEGDNHLPQTITNTTMHITHLKTTNLKGRNIDTDLAQKTIIIGPNASGKTAHLDAIKLAILGRVPEFGKTNKDNFLPSSAGSMEAVVTFNDGTILKRALRMDGDSCTSKGTEPMVLATLEPEAWSGRNAREQIEDMFLLVELPASLTPDGIIAGLQRITFGEEHTEALEKAKVEVVEIVRDQIQLAETLADALVELTREKTGVLPAKQTIQAARVRDMDGAGRTLAELKIREGEASADTQTDIRNEIARLEGLLEEAHKDVGRLQEQTAAAERVAGRITELRGLIAAPAPIPKPAPMNTLASFDVEQAKARLETLESNGITNPPPAPDSEPLEKARSLYSSLKERSLNMAANLTQEENALAELEGLSACPHCQSTGDGWKSNLRGGITARIASLRAELDAVNKKKLAAENDGRTLSGQFNDANALREKFDANLRAWRELSDRIKSNERAQSDFKARCEQVERDNAAAQDRHAALKAQFEKELATTGTIAAPQPSEIEEANRVRTELRDRHAAETTRLRAAEQLQNDLRRAQQAADESEIAAAMVKVLKEVRAALLALKEKLVETAFGGLLSEANAIIGDVLTSPLVYNPSTGEIGRFASEANGNFISHRAFSGTEKALAYVAVAAALSAKSRLRLLILDELGRLTEDVQIRVLSALSLAVDAGRIDQVIAVLPLSPEDAGNFECGDHAGNYMVINTSPEV